MSDEKELFQEFVDYVKRCDIDIFVGFEMQMTSLGYLIERAEVLST